MSDRDNELDSILNPLAEIKVSDAQVTRWKAALREELAKTRISSRKVHVRWLAVTAASLVIGIFIGNYHSAQKSKTVTDDDSNATIEYISVKSL